MSVEPDAPWVELTERLASALTGLRPGTFLVMEYIEATQWDPCPYAQCAPEPDGWYCEVVSEHYLDRDVWPIDELALRREGWCPPDDETANWWRAATGPDHAAAVMMTGLRRGRACPDPDGFFWSVGTFPSGPNGGEPVPVPAFAA